MLEIKNLSKIYGKGHNKITVLEGVDLKIEKGDNIALLGESGSGKSSLLQILGLLDRGVEGEILYNGASLLKKKDRELVEFRKKHIGFIYQFHHLMPEFTALENVMMPLLINGISKKNASDEAERLLRELGLGERLEHKPFALSGGEKQRVAIARGLVHKPSLLLADEPTGNLDPENANIAIDLFLKEIKALGQTTIMVTHNLQLAKKFDIILNIKDKKLVKYV